MSRTQLQIVTELKTRLEAYLDEPTRVSEAEVQALIEELNGTTPVGGECPGADQSAVQAQPPGGSPLAPRETSAPRQVP